MLLYIFCIIIVEMAEQFENIQLETANDYNFFAYVIG